MPAIKFAATVARRLFSAAPRLVSAHLTLSLLLAQSTPTEDGIAAFNAGRYSVSLVKLKNEPSQEARLFYALSQAATGDCPAALPVLTSLAPQERLASLAAVKCLGSQPKAFALLDEATTRWRTDPDVLYLQAKLHMKAFNDTTLAMFQRAPASYRVHQLSAEIFEVQNRYDEAVAEYRKAIEIAPSAPDLHFRLGRAILLGGRDLPKAREAFQAELRLSPEDGACEFQLGQIAQVEGNKPEAKAHFEKALALSPQFVQAMISLAKMESPDKAIPLLSQAVQLQPANETAHYALMTTYRNAGQLDKAKEEKAVLDKLQKPPDGEFSDFLKKLGEKPPAQQ